MSGRGIRLHEKYIFAPKIHVPGSCSRYWTGNCSSVVERPVFTMLVPQSAPDVSLLTTNVLSALLCSITQNKVCFQIEHSFFYSSPFSRRHDIQPQKRLNPSFGTKAGWHAQSGNANPSARLTLFIPGELRPALSLRSAPFRYGPHHCATLPNFCACVIADHPRRPTPPTVENK
jgi:hypothetical protein